MHTLNEKLIQNIKTTNLIEVEIELDNRKDSLC